MIFRFGTTAPLRVARLFERSGLAFRQNLAASDAPRPLCRTQHKAEFLDGAWHLFNARAAKTKNKTVSAAVAAHVGGRKWYKPEVSEGSALRNFSIADSLQEDTKVHARLFSRNFQHRPKRTTQIVNQRVPSFPVKQAHSSNVP